MRYRPDIDGLRAFAIGAVVLFHLDLGPFPGGFAGVDIFFVISGYLITGLILGQLREGQFSFWQFYARRTRRIYPALFVVILFVLIAGYFLLTPGEYETLGLSAVFSAAGLANVYFWLNTGYFDQAAETMPLIHLWSIAVEEQFYLVWPLTLFLIWRFAKTGAPALRTIFLLATILLAILSVVLTAHDAKAAFFLPFARLWEFTLGAFVFLLPPLRNERAANAISVAGLVAMVAAIVFFDESVAWPGYAAILPCLGGAAVIAAGERSFAGRFLSLAPNVFLGKISYSLYLWHWPIIVYYTWYTGALSTENKIWLLVITLAVSALSWWLIEMPIRRKRGEPRRHVALGGITAAVVACLALVVVAKEGFPGRLPPELQVLGDDQAMRVFACTEKIELPGADDDENRCIVGKPWAQAEKRAVIWGDSHAKHLLPLLDVAAREQNLSVAYWSGCPPFIDNTMIQRQKRGNPEYSEDCAESRRSFLDWIDDRPDVDLVILANHWSNYPRVLFREGIFEPSESAKALSLIEKGLVQSIAEIEPEERPVLIVGNMPGPGFPVAECAAVRETLWRRQCEKFKEYFTNKAAPLTEAILKRVAQKEADNIHYVDSMKEMCTPAQGCPIRVANEIIYRDSSHLRHDLSLATRQELVERLDLDEALEDAMHGADEARE